MIGATYAVLAPFAGSAQSLSQSLSLLDNVTRVVAAVGMVRVDSLFGQNRDPVLVFKCGDIVLEKPDWNLDGNRDAVVGQHEPLQFGMPVAVGGDARDDQRRRVGGRILLFHYKEAVERKEIAREFLGARAVVAPEEIVGAGAGNVLQKISERGEPGVALAAVIERAIAQKGELGAVIAEFIDLGVIKLDDPNDLRRAEKFAASFPESAVGREAGMRREPAGNGGRADGVSVAR